MNDFSEFLDDNESAPSAASILQQLTTAWVNEKNSPELMKHATDLVDCMMDQIEQMEENLLQLNRDDFRLVPHQMEVNRIRFILASYHRCRLEKIETFTAYLVNHDKNCQNDDDRLMSAGELVFAEQFLHHLNDHFNEEAYRYMPDILNDDTDEKTMDVTPNLNSSVFIQMVKSVSNIYVNNRLESMPVGSRHLLPYKEVYKLIKDGSAILL